MIALKTVVAVSFLLQTGFTQSPSPVNMDDAPCSDDQNNCPSNSYCYIYSVTGQPYCAESCDLNNGGCGTGQCMMLTVHCIAAPCPPMVQCHSAVSHSITRTTSSLLVLPSPSSIPWPVSHSITRTTSSLLVLPSPSSIPWPGPYTCSRQPESGLCLAYFPRYFYNVTSGRCEKFIYGGCGGNDNRFITSEECYRICGNFVSICELDPEIGICETHIPSYFYNATSKRCEEFIYGGCGETQNINKFPTLEQCQATCDIDVCVLEPEAGNCRGSFLRYFYNKFTGRCELFVYGGCGGNGNRFIDIHLCKKTCLSEPTVSLTPVVSEKNIVTITIGSHDNDIDWLVADFTGDLKKILTDNGITDVSVQIVNISYTPDNDVMLSVAVYSDKDVISGDEIAALINQNKEMFTVPVSGAAVVGDDTNDSKTSDGLSVRALAGIVIGAIVGLILIMILTVGILYFITNRHRIITKHISPKKSDGLNNPIYSDDQME